MVCIYCSSKTYVTNSRSQKRTNAIWRRRRCTECNSIFTSIESVDMGKSIVVKNASALEPFSRDKLLMSIYDSLKHRKTAVTDAAGLTDTVVGRLYNTIKQAQVGTADIIAITSAVLKRFDKAAATHYLAFHPIQASDS